MRDVSSTEAAPKPKPPKQRETPEERDKRIAGLRKYQFKPGQSGNPTGRRKETVNWLKVMKDSNMVHELTELIAGRTRASWDVRFRAMQEVANRTFGKPVDAQVQLRIGEQDAAGAAAQLGPALEAIARLTNYQTPELPESVDGELVAVDPAVNAEPADDNSAE